MRFRAYGERRYVTLGTTADGWSRPQAERELVNILADVDRGIWVPTAPDGRGGPARSRLHGFASEWIAARAGELRETTIADYTWQLSTHLLPFFHRHRLSQITVAEVDRYRRAQGPRERALGGVDLDTAEQIAAILDAATDLDARKEARTAGRRGFMATLAFAGLRMPRPPH